MTVGARTIQNCSISGNAAAYEGGGIGSVAEFGSTMTIRNSTISGNTAGLYGGGIAIDTAGTTPTQPGGTTTIRTAQLPETFPIQILMVPARAVAYSSPHIQERNLFRAQSLPATATIRGLHRTFVATLTTPGVGRLPLPTV